MKKKKVQKLIEVKRYFNFYDSTYYVYFYEFELKSHSILRKPYCRFKKFDYSDRAELNAKLDDMDGEVLLKMGSEGVLNFAGARVYFNKKI